MRQVPQRVNSEAKDLSFFGKPECREQKKAIAVIGQTANFTVSS